MRVEPRLRFSWAERSFLLTCVLIHALAVWSNLRGEVPVQLPKWFDLTFGIPSPTSGTGRAILAVDRGELREAFLFNPVGAIAGLYMLVFPVYLALSWRVGKVVVLSHRLSRIILVAAFAALVAAWWVKLRWISPEWW